MTAGPLLSVVVPAHDEEQVIGRCLATMLRDARPGELDVVVVCNGCTDGTAERAAAYGPDVRVVSIPTASKPAALNAGDGLARTFPRAYVDADVEVGAAALRALADTLTRPGGPLAAAPTLHVDTSGTTWGVRAHYAVWEHSDYRRDDLIGSGVYALSAAGRRRFAEFPPVIADDLYVRNLFAPHERRALPDHTFTVRAPRTVPAMVRRSTRAAAGNLQWRRRYGPAATPAPAVAAPSPAAGCRPPAATMSSPSVRSRGALLRRLARRPGLWPATVPYAYVYVAARVLGRRKLAGEHAAVWDRDRTSREVG